MKINDSKMTNNTSSEGRWSGFQLWLYYWAALELTDKMFIVASISKGCKG